MKKLARRISFVGSCGILYWKMYYREKPLYPSTTFCRILFDGDTFARESGNKTILRAVGVPLIPQRLSLIHI